jgi:hypothetical protein
VDGDNAAGLVVRQCHDSAHGQFAAGADEGAEVVGVAGVREEVENFGAAAAARVPEQTRRKDAAAIDDEQVAFVKVIGEGGEPSVLDGAADAVEEQQPRCVPIGKGLLRDQFGREVEVEVGGLQKSFFCGRSGSGRSSPKCW